jgi:hypothetical protein
VSRDHRSLHSATALLDSHGIEVTRGGGKHRPGSAEVQTTVATLELVIALDAMADEARVIHDREPAGDCEHCDSDPARPADIEVYTRTPGGERTHVAVCQMCAPDVIAKATGWIWVEVLVP